MITSIEQLIFEIQEKRQTAVTTTPKRSRWSRKDEALFEQVKFSILSWWFASAAITDFWGVFCRTRPNGSYASAIASLCGVVEIEWRRWRSKFSPPVERISSTKTTCRRPSPPRKKRDHPHLIYRPKVCSEASTASIILSIHLSMHRPITINAVSVTSATVAKVPSFTCRF